MSEIRYVTAPIGAELVDRGLQVVPGRDISILPRQTRVEVLFSTPLFAFLQSPWQDASGSPANYLRISANNLKTKTSDVAPVTYTAGVSGVPGSHLDIVALPDRDIATLVINGPQGDTLLALDFHGDKIVLGTWPNGQDEWESFASINSDGIVEVDALRKGGETFTRR